MSLISSFQDLLVRDHENGFKVSLDTARMPFLSHHGFAERCLVPGAIMIEILVAAVAAITGRTRIHPLRIRSLSILRGVSIPQGGAQDVSISVRQVDDGIGSTFQATLSQDLTNKSGAVVRRGVPVAIMCLTFGGESDALSVPLEIVSGRRYELPVGPFYDLAFKTHGELFRSLSGVIILGAEDAEIDAIFSVGRRERGYWASGDARFAVGPLGLDSVLQTAVFASVLHGDGGNESYFSKLPVELGDWALLRPFDETAEYTCRCRVVETSGRDMKLCATVIDGDGAPVLDAHHTLLREAPFVRFTRGEIHETLRQYERAS